MLRVGTRGKLALRGDEQQQGGHLKARLLFLTLLPLPGLGSPMYVSYPLITPTERKRATLRAIPARCTTFTTRSTSL